MTLRRIAMALALLAVLAAAWFFRGSNDTAKVQPLEKSAAITAAPETSGAPTPASHAPASSVPASYSYSALYRRVDLSFSAIPIDTRFATVKDRLKELRINGCEESQECAWADTAGVEHRFWALGEDYDNRDSDQVVVKRITASVSAGKPIEALGIQTARSKDQVLTNVRKFLPEITVNCEPPDEGGEIGYEECGGTVDPGWFRIGFDKDGQLLIVQFDAYHFT